MLSLSLQIKVEYKNMKKGGNSRDKAKGGGDKPKYSEKKGEGNRNKAKREGGKPKYSEKKGEGNRTKVKREGDKSKYSGEKKSKYLGNDESATTTPGINKRSRARGGITLPKFDDKVRLNKYLSNAGICSRREADTLIASGVVSVNGVVITEMGYKVHSTDTVKYDGAKIKNEEKRYVLVNKPKEFSVQYEENPNKDSVYHFIHKACKEILYPVGKLDKSNCGLVLYTNDNDMNMKLTHHKFKVSQLFHVILDREMSIDDLAKLTNGMYVDNKMFSAAEAEFVTGKSGNEIGVHVYSNKSNTVKLMIGKLGYEIVKLDRVEYAGLTKKDLPRGMFRHLTEMEVIFLKRN